MNELVSIVTTLYNYRRFINDLAQSIFNQTSGNGALGNIALERSSGYVTLSWVTPINIYGVDASNSILWNRPYLGVPNSNITSICGVPIENITLVNGVP